MLPPHLIVRGLPARNRNIMLRCLLLKESAVFKEKLLCRTPAVDEVTTAVVPTRRWLSGPHDVSGCCDVKNTVVCRHKGGPDEKYCVDKEKIAPKGGEL